MAVLLGFGMLGLQFAIGAANDWCDVDLDAIAKPGKPIPAGLVSRPVAAMVAFACAGGGLAAAALATDGGPTGPRALPTAALILAIGLVYDAWLKRTAWGWLAFAVAFPLLPLYAWYGAAGYAPPRAELVLPVAFLAGPALQLANGLVDIERDAMAGVAGLAGAIGRRRSLALLIGLQVTIQALAWATIGGFADSGLLPVLAIGLSSLLTTVGVYLSAADAPALREWGWRCQAVAIASLALGWLTWASAMPSPGG
jgi:4-hydroxybenzoate polyprenyltransferase